MKITTFPGLQALRLPLWAPNEDEGGGTGDDPFAEQPGDREPDPDAAGGEDDGNTEDDGDAGDGDGAEDGDGSAGDGDAGAEGDDGEGDADAGDAGGEDGDGEADPPVVPKKSWKDRQIIKLRQQLKAKDDALAARGTQTEAAPDGGASTVTGGAGEDLVPRAQAVAEAKAQLERENRFKTINERSDAMYDAGAKAFAKTWAPRVTEAAEALGDEIVAKPEFLETLTELPNAAAVYHELSGDLDEFERVLNLPPAKMGLELARLSTKLTPVAKPKTATKTPAPIKPLNTTTSDDLALDDPNLSQDEFNRRMDAEEEKRYASRRR